MSRSYEWSNKTLVGLAIEQTLLRIGKPAFDKVEALLNERYHCTISDSYDNPHYLTEVLKEVFGKSYLEILGNIEDHLEDFRQDQPIEDFIAKINR